MDIWKKHFSINKNTLNYSKCMHVQFIFYLLCSRKKDTFLFKPNQTHICKLFLHANSKSVEADVSNAIVCNSVFREQFRTNLNA